MIVLKPKDAEISEANSKALGRLGRFGYNLVILTEANKKDVVEACESEMARGQDIILLPPIDLRMYRKLILTGIKLDKKLGAGGVYALENGEKI